MYNSVVALQTNVLYYGDNLDVLRKYIPDESIDLIYLDPPFNSNRSYNVLFRESSGAGSEAQIEAFGDTWHWGRHAQATFEEVVTGRHQSVARILQAMVDGLGHNDVTAYLAMMAIRLVELRRILKNTGSIYLHCDPTAGDYLKVIMDAVFGPKNFRNQIVWQRSHPHGNVSRKFGSIHDLLLFYVKDSKAAKWNQPAIAHDSSDERIRKQYSRWDEERQDWWQPTSLLNPNPNRPNLTYEFHGHTKVWRWTREKMLEAEREGHIYVPPDGGIPRFKRFLGEQRGLLLQDVWDDIEPVTGQEALGYETQKPVELLERIVDASSDAGDVVLDPFCGCGTAVHAAHKLERRWIGIDITHLAIGLIRRRMQDAFPGIEIKVFGEPVDLGGAQELAATKPQQFEFWVVDKLDGIPTGGKGPDLDGYLPFIEFGGAVKRAVISVKGTKQVAPEMLREVLGAMNDEKPIGVLATLTPPTKGMQTQAAAAGFYESSGRKHPKLQILTVAEILKGKSPDVPPRQAAFAQARREQGKVKTRRLL